MAKKRKDGRLQKKFTFKGKTYFVYGHNAKELFNAEVKKREELEQGFEKRDNPTVSEYYDRWIAAKEGKVKEATLWRNRKIFAVVSEIRIESAKRSFGEMKIKEVSIDDLRKIQTLLLEERKSITVNDYMAHVKHFMGDALKERIIDYNPCVLLDNVKRTEERARDTYHRALTIEEQQTFFNCDRCKSSYYNNIFRLAVNTGMRLGEIGALKNSDIRKDTIYIERTITRTDSGAYIIGEDAKTEAGRRAIPMNEQIKAIISEQKEINRLINGKVVSMNDLLFKAPEGGLLMATPADREIKRICKKVDIEPFTMHALRATFATRAIESGMNPKTLQEILGHSSFNITMSLYGHALADTKKAEMDAIAIII